MSKFIILIALTAVLAIAVQSEIVAPKEPVLISARSNDRAARPQSNSNNQNAGGDDDDDDNSQKSELSLSVSSCGSDSDILYFNTSYSKDYKSQIARLVVNKRIPLDFEVLIFYNFYK
jgi:hypothetical protein